MKTWGDREKSRAQYAFTAQQQLASNEGQEPAGVALTLSRRLIAVVKVKKILNVEAGLEMMALAMTIASEVRGIYPTMTPSIYSELVRILVYSRKLPMNFKIF